MKQSDSGLPGIRLELGSRWRVISNNVQFVRCIVTPGTLGIHFPKCSIYLCTIEEKWSRHGVKLKL